MNLGSRRSLCVERVEDALPALGLSAPRHCRPSGPIPDDWSLEPEALYLLLAWVECRRPTRYLEIGGYRGDTVMRVVATLEDVPSLKAFVIEPDPKQARLIRSRIRPKSMPITVIEATSSAAFEGWGREPLDLILIDGDHSLSSTVFDIAAWSTLLAPEGCLVVHDTVTRLRGRFPEDYIAALPSFDIVDIVGIRHLKSGNAWEGIAFITWADGVRDSVARRYERANP